MTGFVADASVGAGWVIKNQLSGYSEAARLALLDEPVHVPALWWLEMTNMLRTGCRRQSITSAEAYGFIEMLRALPIQTEQQEGKMPQLLSLALRHDLSAYDASYLDLALRRQLPIATQDAALHEAALASGVGVWRPA